MDEKFKMSSDLRTLLGSYDGNIYEPEVVMPYFLSLSDEGKVSLKEEMNIRIKNHTNLKSWIKQAVGEGFHSDKSVTKFLISVKNYLFNDGSEPDISEYID